MILHVRSSAGLFGADRVVLDLCEMLPAQGYRCVLVPLIEADGSGVAFMQEAVARGVPVSPLHLRRPMDFKALYGLRKIADETGAALLHGHDYKSDIALFMAGKSRKRIVTLHGRVGTSRALRLKEGLDRFVVNRFDRVLCVSQGQAEAEEKKGIRNITVVPNGIDPRPFQSAIPVSDEYRKSLGIEPGETVVGAIGRLSEEKGYDFLLRVCARLLNDGMKFKILLAGEGPEEKSLRELATQLGIGDRLLLTGFRRDTASLYPILDVFCMPSHREGLPLALLEAMASGCAVAANGVGGIPEVVGRDGSCGLTLSLGDTENWVSALGDLLRNPEKRKSLGDAARKKVNASFSREGMARGVARVYRELLDS